MCEIHILSQERQEVLTETGQWVVWVSGSLCCIQWDCERELIPTENTLTEEMVETDTLATFTKYLDQHLNYQVIEVYRLNAG